MKIISKFKDFYDYISPYRDDTNVWNRVKETKRLDFNEREVSDIGTIHNEICKKYHLRILHWHSIESSGTNIGTYIVGIYPKIYCVDVRYRGWYNEERAILSKEFHDEEKIKREMTPWSRIDWAFSYRKDGLYRILDHKDSGVEIDMKPIEWKDCEFFKTAPLFIYDFCTIHCNLTRLDITYNPCFKDIDKGIPGFCNRLDELDPEWRNNIYDRIENYLYAMKVEPISEPDNKTRIINAGFDLKTSFRNM